MKDPERQVGGPGPGCLRRVEFAEALEGCGEEVVIGGVGGRGVERGVQGEEGADGGGEGDEKGEGGVVGEGKMRGGEVGDEGGGGGVGGLGCGVHGVPGGEVAVTEGGRRVGVW